MNTEKELIEIFSDKAPVDPAQIILPLSRADDAGMEPLDAAEMVAGELPIEHLVKIVERLIHKTTLWIVNLEMRRGS